MKNKILLERLSNQAALLLEAYVDSGGVDLPDGAISAFNDLNLHRTEMNSRHLASTLSLVESWNIEEKLCVSLLFELEEQRKNYYFLNSFVNRQEEVLAIVADLKRPPEMADLAKSIKHIGLKIHNLDQNATIDQPFASPFKNIYWQHFDWSDLSDLDCGTITALARWYPRKLVDKLSQDPNLISDYMSYGRANWVFKETNLADDIFVSWAEQNLTLTDPNPFIAIARSPARNSAFSRIKILSELRNDKYHDLVMRLALMPEYTLNWHAIDMILRHRPDIALDTIGNAIDRSLVHHIPNGDDLNVFTRLIDHAIEDISNRGAPFLQKILANGKLGFLNQVLKLMLDVCCPDKAEIIRKILLSYAASLTKGEITDFWKMLALYDRGLFLTEWRSLAKSKSKPMREIASKWLLEHQESDVLTNLDQLLGSSVMNDRLAGISLLASSLTPQALERLRSTHGSEPTKQVRLTIASVLSKNGIIVPAEPEKEVQKIQDITAFESSLFKKAKTIRMPQASWLDVDVLPPLKTICGKQLSKLALTYMFQSQAREGPGKVSAEVKALLPHLNKIENTDFARLLLDQWFASDMKSTTRWALVIVGITADDSLVERLVEPIPSWCKANHGSRAEWVVHALSLIASEKAVAMLETLSLRYRNSRKYVGIAATKAIVSAAEKMGIGLDELSERLVSDCGFDSEGCRVFQTAGGHTTAQLGLDFKISWKDDETGRLMKTPTQKLIVEAEAEFKDIQKSIKHAVSLQTTRLQDAMLTERRWDIATWRSRFERHPIFRIMAMRIIWATYDENGIMLNTFRLYQNGLTATADGKLEEFIAPSHAIGIIHRLNLDTKSKETWADHLCRFRVKPLFEQLERPIYKLDPLHGNRKELKTTDGFKTTAGELRSKLFARNWSFDSTGDGGWVCCAVRAFPSCGMHIYLRIEDLHAASPKDDEIMLGSAFFTRDQKNNPDDAEAIRFDQVPPLVYSETLADLNAIIATKS